MTVFMMIILLSACQVQTEPAADTAGGEGSEAAPEAEAAVALPTDTPQPTAVPDTPRISEEPEMPAEPTAVPTEPAEEPPAEPVNEVAAAPAVTSGRIEAGAFFLGDPDAPITMIDYSDFL